MPKSLLTSRRQRSIVRLITLLELWQELIVRDAGRSAIRSTRALGIVVGTKATSDLTNVKEIVRVLDETPTYTEELLELSAYLSETTLCFQATALLAIFRLPP
ncbi:hypothetical protein OVA29_07540 [Exiguobacterium sp. SL14]|nr:hypothetical protein [Exiguobacterium sp. SL14]MCY1690575.1 hypothetical protein [Exiguobacterium sp. SL14]